jgi:membrane protease YdiL (CAAX protease family)
MPDWATFAGFAGVVLVLLLLLAHASTSMVSGNPSTRDAGDRRSRRGHPYPGSVDPAVTERPDSTTVDADRTVDGGGSAVDAGPALSADAEVDRWTDRVHATQPELSTVALLGNVAFSQGTFGFLLLAGAWFTEIPAAAFGVSSATLSVATLGAGAGLGLALYAANEVAATVGDRLGLGADEGLREALAPSSAVGWAVLLLVVLPIIAGFEELLFRGILVGVFAAGFGLSPWLLAALSSVAFALGHGAQGPAGVVVTGLLGFVLAVAFVLTGSLLVVVVAHYLVNALEFVVHEGLDVDWT